MENINACPICGRPPLDSLDDGKRYCYVCICGWKWPEEDADLFGNPKPIGTEDEVPEEEQ